MQRKSFADMECSIARSLDQMGDGWALLVVRNALLGARRFQEFEQRLAIAPTTLTRRLEELTRLGLLVKRTYEQRPPREEYELTAKGNDLAPVLLALSAWGNRWLSPRGAPLEPVDAETGEPVQPIVVDCRTLKPLTSGKVALRAGPGASRKLRRALTCPILFGTPDRAEVSP